MKYLLVYAQIDMKNMHFFIQDGSSPPNQLEIKFNNGTMKWDEMHNREYILNRGLLSDVRDGDQSPMEVSWDGQFEYIKSHITSTDGETITVPEALKRNGAAAAWKSSDSDQCNPYSVDLLVTNSPICLNNLNEQMLFPDFRYEKLSFDPKAGTISVSGKCNAIEVNASRVAQTT
jgi:hypothetical protein